ncbi:hypothetical protein NPA31_011840 [Aurantimonas sp. MSK8Z-1]|uniref:hypothetical protein n=1 Tax=Mangrovibrevibacter kandeliae TaxID=2968473 RepID=UPI002119AF50|nr:hypothetical protein [Aurantimonas sp. MSK8Z-1]MCW4115655.1 hypothetical protein [Aurantimonas sp. MSK8Z-1]
MSDTPRRSSMHITVEVRGARKPGVWSIADTTDDLETATNIARSWFAKGYVVRTRIDRA